MCPIFMKFGTKNKSNMLIMNMLIGTDDLDPKLKCPQKKLNMLIMNIVRRIGDLDTKLCILANLVPTLKFTPSFMKFGTQNWTC